jgi:hypothetical protein
MIQGGYVVYFILVKDAFAKGQLSSTGRCVRSLPTRFLNYHIGINVLKRRVNRFGIGAHNRCQNNENGYQYGDREKISYSSSFPSDQFFG